MRLIEIFHQTHLKSLARFFRTRTHTHTHAHAHEDDFTFADLNQSQQGRGNRGGQLEKITNGQAACLAQGIQAICDSLLLERLSSLTTEEYRCCSHHLLNCQEGARIRRRFNEAVRAKELQNVDTRQSKCMRGDCERALHTWKIDLRLCKRDVYVCKRDHTQTQT